ncbi:MAG: CBS domain-containing protein [Deltaproteobacteria bacterium]|nr:CBS domain-containing protein [Deltaproteobacteria bacterium]NND30016.1 CBS domain-containing protein [Myxococcales bacterium]MBT8480852.1 CBS domain-containing protein [Deltaproteobacteria bacterium]NNK08127.1 CBS domain-containing protein [Myxococcales bacterium]NNK42990.1 CBS domain-containing protein [Myxococcales bacterium]
MAKFEMPATDYMTSPVETIRVGESLVAADAMFTKQGVSALGVVDDIGELKGVVSRTDLLHAAVSDQGVTFRVPDRPVEEIMQSPALQVSRDAPVAAAAKLMLKKHVHRIFVTSAGKPDGVISTRDLMRAVGEKRIKTPISEIASGSVVKIRAEDPIAMAVDRLELSNKHGLVVVEGDFPVGIFDQACALQARRLSPTTAVENVMNVRILILPDAMGLGRAAVQALAMNVRRILIEHDRGVAGIVGGLDFARVMK